VKRIGIAVVESAGSYLVGLRAPGTALAGMSEFPGGKCEADETPQACAVRECLEETGLAVIPRLQLGTVPWDYPHGAVELHFWLCSPAHDLPPQLSPTPPFRWVPAGELQALTFPPANQQVLNLLQQRVQP
jgi:mutator protein MutT